MCFCSIRKIMEGEKIMETKESTIFDRIVEIFHTEDDYHNDSLRAGIYDDRPLVMMTR